MANVIEIIIEGTDKASSVLTGIGKGISGLAVGATALAAAGAAAAVGLAVAVGDMMSDVNQATNNLQAELGITGEEAKQLGDIAQAVWANNFGDDIQEAASVVSILRRQIQGLSDEDLQDATENAFRLSDVFDVDVNESINAAAVLMEEFGLTQQEAFDLIASGFQEGLNSSDDFIDSIREYGNLFAGAGFEADQMFSIMQTGMAGGVLGTDKISDAIKEMTIRLGEGGDDVNDAFETMGFNFERASGLVASGEREWADYFDNIVSGLSQIEDPMERQAAQTAIFGTMAEDLGLAFTDSLSSMTVSLGEMGGAVDSLDVKYQNFGALFEGVKRQFLTAFTPIGEKVLALANEFLPPLLDAFSGFISNIEEGMTPIDAFIEAIWDIAPQEVLNALINFRDNILPGLIQRFDEVKTFILETVVPIFQQILSAAINHLAWVWENILWPTMQAVWDWMSNVLIPFLRDVVFPWLADNIPDALQILSDFWSGVLWPAIQAVWDWMSNVLIPFLRDVVFPWLQKKIPEALQTLSDFWTETLKPALEAVWKFLTEDMMPVWDALGRLFEVAIPLAIAVLKGVWNELKDTLTEFWNETLKPIVDFIGEKVIKIFGDWSEGIGGITGAISEVAGWIDTLTEKLSNIELPDWMTPGSPTPWELGLRGVVDAMNQLNTVQLPQMARTLAVVGGGGNGTTNNFILNSTPAPGQSIEGEYRTMAAFAGGI